MDSNIEKFIEDLKQTCKENNIDIILSEDTHVDYPNSDMRVNGYFTDKPTPRLATAIGKPEEQWVEILIHESSHMDQYLENIDAWKNLFVTEDKDATDLMDEWLSSKIELDDEELNRIIGLSQNIELDCEKRSIEKIKKYGISVDVDKYIQKANAYVYFYSIIKKYRKWYKPGKEPYNTIEVYEKLPNHFDNDYENIPMEIEELYVKYCLS
jgi:hypothetical protein